MITERFLRGRGREILDDAEVAALEGAVTATRPVAGREVLVARGERVKSSSLLIEGYACRYMDDREGRRQLVAVHVPGDFIDLHGFPMRVLDHDIATLGPAVIATVDHRRLTEITEHYPRLTRMLWFSTLLDAAMHREWIFALGRLDAEGRVAHLFCELEARLAMVGLSDEGSFPLNLTQMDIGEACGMTGVHVNRTLRKLREAGLLTFNQGVATLHDRRRLATLAEFTPDYLYPGHGWAARDA